MNTILSSFAPRTASGGLLRLLQWGACLLLGCQREVPDESPTPVHVRTAQEFVGIWGYETGSFSWSCDSGEGGEESITFGERSLTWLDAYTVGSEDVCGLNTCVECALRFRQSMDSPDVVVGETEACEREYSTGSTYVISLTHWEFELSQSGNMLTEYAVSESAYTKEGVTGICYYWTRAFLFRVPVE